MWLTNLKLVLPGGVVESGAVCIEEGRIAEVCEDGAPSGVDMGGLTAVPGLVDLHGDMFEYEAEPRPKASFPIDCALCEVDKRLIGNGITTAYCAIAFTWEDWGELRSEARAREFVDGVLELRPRLLADHRLHVRFAITNPEGGHILRELIEQDKVHLFSLMDHTPGQGQFRDIEAYKQFAKKWYKLRAGGDWTDSEVNNHIERMEKRPKAWDLVRELCTLAAQHGIPFSSHDDDSPDKVALMHELGAAMSEFPIDLATAHAAREMGLHVIMGAPNALRGVSSTVGNLSAQDGIAAGVVDVLASDYYPAAMLQAPFALARRGVLSLHDAVNLVSRNPALAAGLADRGEISAGKQADLAIVEEGDLVRVRATMRAGRWVYNDGACPALSHAEEEAPATVSAVE